MKLVDKHADILEVDYREGALILVDKPLEWSSFSVVNKIRWVLRHHYGIKKIKVGHGGTLDPLATGLLLIFTGKATKQINEYMGMDKSYLADIKMGFTTASYDAEQPEEEEKNVDHLTDAIIAENVLKFEGEQIQLAPIYSALKQGGQPMYKMARKGIPVERKSRKVIFHKLELLGYDAPIAKVDISCSKGTYIRSFAHDIGQNIGVGAYLNGLVRTSVGSFQLKDAFSLSEFVEKFKND